MCRSILLLSKITHQKWHDCPFCQRNMTTERAVGMGVEGDREVEGDGQNFKKCGEQGVGNIGEVFMK